MADEATSSADDPGFLQLDSIASMQRLGEDAAGAFFAADSTLVNLDAAAEQKARSAADSHRLEMARGHHLSERYKVVSEIARGGMGAVLEVHDSDLDRRVAMKVLLRDARMRETDTGSPLDTGPVDRFMGEAQLTGNLEHPNIVPVHELGLDSQGRVYFTMKRVKGRSLRQIMDKLRQGHAATLAEFPVGRLLTILLKVCDAIDFAHSRGIIHRDLKPENIMVGQFGEVLVMDWGLAKQVDERDVLRPAESAKFNLEVSLGALDGDASVTREGTISGTPAYMAPEQARGQIEALSRHTDVFCLGAVLYEMLCLAPPFLAADMADALEQARKHKLLEPRAKLERVLADSKLKPAFGQAGIERGRKHPRELASIARRAMAEDRMKRYHGVAEMRRDIENFMSAQPVSAHRDRPWTAISKWTRRNPTRAAVLTLALFFLLAGGAVFAGVRAKINSDRYALSEANRVAVEQRREETERRLGAEQIALREAIQARENAERVAQLEQKNIERERREAEALAARAEAFVPYSHGADLRARAASFTDWHEKARLWAQAAGLFRLALEHDPTFVEAHMELANVYADLGFDDDALSHYARADALTANQTERGHVEALMAYAMYDFQRKVLREGLSGGLEEVFRRFRPVRDAAEPGSHYARIAGVLISLGEAYRSAEGAAFLRARDNAADQLAAIESEGMPLWEVYTLLALFEDGFESVDARRDHLRRARELKPNLPLLVWLDVRHDARSSSVLERRAVAAWDEFIRRFPYDPRGWYSRAALRFQSDHERAYQAEVQDLRQAIALNPRYPDAHKLLLRVHVREAEYSRAIQHIDAMRRSQSGLDHIAINLIEAELTAATGEFDRLAVLVMAAMQESSVDGTNTLAQAVAVLLRDHEYQTLADLCEIVEERMGSGTPPAVLLFLGRALTMLGRFDEATQVLRIVEENASALPREYRTVLAGWFDDARSYPMLLSTPASLPAPRSRFDVARIMAVAGHDPEQWVPLFNTDGVRPNDMANWVYPGDYMLRAIGNAMLARRFGGAQARGLRAVAVQDLRQAFEEGYLNRARVLGNEYLAPLVTDSELSRYFDLR